MGSAQLAKRKRTALVREEHVAMHPTTTQPPPQSAAQPAPTYNGAGEGVRAGGAGAIHTYTHSPFRVALAWWGMSSRRRFSPLRAERWVGVGYRSKGRFRSVG
jgi:hypothetical protein